ncbi:FMN reductase [Fodinicola acaciae]|uniref:FMN reductase n=1 Tax=Fodinicola acaciae TaxID=2681555 RepID=UPI0013D1158F|nr:CE1759 family FMN reductase [Fodinicola acaciae]
METKKIVVITAGLSQPSSSRLLADRLAEASALALRDFGADAEIQVVELRDFAVDIAKNLVSMVPSGALRTVINAVTSADGLIVVSPVFTASYSGLFKSFFDLLDNDALVGMPVLMGATGGTERHSLMLDYQMRPMFAYLRSVVTPTAVYAASSDWGSTDGHLATRIDRAAGEFAQTLAGRTPKPPEPDFIPFDQLLDNR